VGDMESEQYLYAISRFQVRTGAQVCVLGVGMLVNNNGEQKTKPLQHAVQELRRHFIAPDVLCVRCDMVLADFPIGLRQKIAQSCHMDENAIIVSGKVKSIYEVPQLLHGQKLTELVCRKLGLLWRGTLTPDFTSYQRILQHLERTQLQSPQLPVRRVAIIAKYSGVDTYLSILRALEHASFAQGIWMQYEFVDAERLESNDHNDRPELLLADFQCILVPGGFGSRGVEGKMRAIRFARQTRRPFLGICLGMQLFVIDHCRTVLGWHDANSTEFDPDTPKPVVRHLSAYGDTLVKQLHLGGTMKLGLHKTRVTPLTRAAVIYSGSSEVRERHRHRYEVSMVKDIEQATASLHPESQILFSGWWQPPDQSLNCIPDIVESADPHWWAVGCQFHPEFLSRNENPHPLFVAFLSAQVV
jgi:CTP synthase